MAKKAQLKAWRKVFRETCFERDNHKCVMCGRAATAVHHIIDRNEIENGGYVRENGISLCDPCHEKAETEHAEGRSTPGYESEMLFKMVFSSEEKARAAVEKLK